MSDNSDNPFVFDEIFGPGATYLTAMNALRQRSELTFAMRELKRNGTFHPIRIGKKKVTATHPISGYQYIFRFQDTLDFNEIMVFNSFAIKRDYFRDALRLIDPILFMCVNRIVCIQTEDELEEYASSAGMPEDKKQFIKTHNGTFIPERQDIVINTAHMWPWVYEHEPDASKQPLLFVFFLFDVVLHELFHAHQNNPLISGYLQATSPEEQERAAEEYVEQHLPGILQHLGFIA